MIFFRITILFLLTGLPQLLFADERTALELADPSPLKIPLIEAVGEEVVQQALDSGRYIYIGSDKCRFCHRDFFLGRKLDVHDSAFEPLIDTKYETEERCLACHTTGYGIKGGFTSRKKTPNLMNVQCEGCHGPGSEHVRRNAVGGFLAGSDNPDLLAKMCLSCHTERWDRSFVDFHEAYDSYRTAAPTPINSNSRVE